MSADATDSGASHTTEGQQEAMSLPWAGDPCADAKTALLKYARQNAAGAPVIIAVRAVVDGDAIAGMQTTASRSDSIGITRTCSKPLDGTASCGWNPGPPPFT